jgi:hypothetical protein
MSHVTEKWTVNKIKDAMRAAGSHWFDPDTMRTFGTEVLPTVYQGPGGVFFVTKDNQYRRELPKRYTVRKFDAERNDVGTHGELCGYKTAQAAQQAARLAAYGPGDFTPEGRVNEHTETFRAVSVLEQFLADLRKHGDPSTHIAVARCLIQHARHHHKLMENYCNGIDIYDKDGEPLRPLRNLRGMIEANAKAAECASVIFSGDPRGCTVKLTFKDGYTNDFAHEGYCVPTGEDD